jgi:PAS domain S-box-containing protein
MVGHQNEKMGEGDNLENEAAERGYVEGELIRSEAKYRSLVEKAGAGIATSDLEGRLSYVNEKMCEIMGYTKDNLVGRQFIDFIHPDDKESILELFMNAAEKPYVGNDLEFRVLHKNGNVMYLYTKPTVLWLAGEIQGFNAIITDVTERRLMEEKLKEAEESHALFRDNFEGIVYQDTDMDFVPNFLSGAFKAITGYTEEEVLTGKTQWKDIVHPDDWPTIATTVEKLRSIPGYSIEIEYRIVTKEGETRWLNEYVHNACDESEKPKSIQGAMHDITERKLAQEALLNEERKFKSLAENSPNMIFINRRGKIEYANNRCEEVTGYTRDELCSPEFDFHCLVAPESKELVIENFQKHMRNEEVPPYEYSIINKNGEKLEIIITTKLIPFQGETAILGTITDITDRKRAEDALRDSEERMGAFMNSATDSFTWFDSKLNLVDINESGLRLVPGLKREDVLGKNLSDLAPDSEKTGRLEDYKKVIDTGQPLSFDEIISHTKFGPIHVSIRAFKVGDGLGLITNDITERKKATMALRESEERYRSLVETSHDLIWKCDAEGKFTYLNKAWEKTHGYEVEEMLGRKFTEFQLPEVAEHDTKEFGRNMAGGSVVGYETTHIAKSGEVINLVFNAIPIYNQNGEVVGTQGTAYDITDRKRAEQALKESEEKFRNYIENAPDGVLVVDEDGRYLEANDAICRITGYSKEELFEMSIPDTLAPESLEDGAKHFRDVVDEGRASGDLAFVRKDGTKGHWRVDAVKISESTYIGFIKDITEQRMAEEAVRESEKFLRKAQEVAKIGSWQWDIEKDDITWSEELYRLYDIDPKKGPLTYDKLMERVHPDDREYHDKHTASWIENKGGEPFEYRVMRRDGSIRHINGLGEVECDEEGKPMRMFGIVQDVTERKLADKALHESESRYRTLFEKSPASVTLVNMSGSIEDCNEATEKLIGYSKEEIMGMEFEKLLTLKTEDLPKLQERFLTLVQGKDVEPYQLEIQRKDGESRWISIINSLQTDGEQLAGIQVIATDNTDAKLADQALRNSEKRLLDAQRIGKMGSWEWDIETNELYWSDEIYRSLGLDPQEFVPKYDDFIKILHPDDKEGVLAAVKAAMEGKKEYSVDHRVIKSDGTIVHMYCHGEVNRNENGDPVHMVGTMVDITDKKKADRALRESEERYRSLTQAALDGIIGIDGKGCITFWNKGSTRIFGHAEEEAIGRDFVELLVPKDHRERVSKKSKEFHENGALGPMTGKVSEAVALRKSNEIFPVELSIAPVRSKGSWESVVVVRDISERRQIEEAKTRLLSNISHELRTPLTSIAGYAKFMLTGKLGELCGNHERCLNIIADESDRLRTLIDDTLDLITIDSGGAEMEMNDVTLTEIIEQLISSMEIELKEKHISLEKKIPGDMRPIKGDEDRLFQLFSNLLSNAMKFTPKGGLIEIRSREEDGDIVVEVADTGIGIPADELPRVFERFYQVDSSLARKYGGMGLGLAICDEIVEAHGGKIEAESTEGRGSVFRVSLPGIQEEIDEKQ